jgi:hypothetical protein
MSALSKSLMALMARRMMTRRFFGKHQLDLVDNRGITSSSLKVTTIYREAVAQVTKAEYQGPTALKIAHLGYLQMQYRPHE